MNQTGKVLFSCALGAGTGALIGLQVTHAWWGALIAAICGFLVGYPAYEFKKVVMAVPVAWKQARNWQPNREFWRDYFKRVAFVNNLSWIIMTPMTSQLLWNWYRACKLDAWGIIGHGSALMFLISVTSCALAIGPDKPFPFVAVNPIRFYLWSVPKFIFWRIPKFVMKVAPRIPPVLKSAALGLEAGLLAIGRFLGELTKIIHSDIRLLCGVDAAIGAAVGFYSGNALIGALVGGLWGAFNFEVLSIRILKLVPQSQSLFRR